MMNLPLEKACCVLCDGSSFAEMYTFPPFAVVRCRDCDFFYLSPRPREEAMLRIYQKDEYFRNNGHGYSDYDQQEKSLRATFRKVVANLDKLNLTGGDLLEVGCGYGFLLAEAKGFFDRRVGTDFSAEAIERARISADRVYHGGLEALPVEQKFDCIIATHVIEHVYHPKIFLRELYKHLKPGGRAVIATPNMGSLWRRLMGHRWPSFKIPEHIHYFDQQSLAALMRTTGFLDLDVLPYPHAFPLPLIAAKLQVPLPTALNKFHFWLPATTVAMYGFSARERVD